MNASLPGDFKVTSLALALGLAVATLVLLPISAFAASLPTVDYDVLPGDFKEYPIVGVHAGDKVFILISVIGGPRVDFYFVDSAGFHQLSTGWPNPGHFDYFMEFSAINETSIDKTAIIPSDGLYYVVVANRDATQTASISGTIRMTTPYPAELITIAVILISVGAVVAVVVAVLVRRSFRSRLSHYSPPGTPTPPSLAHQHMQAQRQVTQQELGRPCPQCGYENSKGATLCNKCGAQL